MPMPSALKSDARSVQLRKEFQELVAEMGPLPCGFLAFNSTPNDNQTDVESAAMHAARLTLGAVPGEDAKCAQLRVVRLAKAFERLQAASQKRSELRTRGNLQAS